MNLPAAQTPKLPYGLAVALVCAGNGLLLTLCDRFSHVQFGALSYTSPIFTGQAWWVLPNFMLAAGGMYLGALLLFARHVRLPSTTQLLTSTLAFVAVYALSGLFNEHPQALLWAFVLSWLARLALSPDRTPLALFGVVLALVGCVVEGLITRTGEFAYRAPEFFHVPLWLAGLYLHGSIAILYIVRRLESAYGRLPG